LIIKASSKEITRKIYRIKKEFRVRVREECLKGEGYSQHTQHTGELLVITLIYIPLKGRPL
jgi:hypothetical protein